MTAEQFAEIMGALKDVQILGVWVIGILFFRVCAASWRR
jgi:hypothetical protein